MNALATAIPLARHTCSFLLLSADSFLTVTIADAPALWVRNERLLFDPTSRLCAEDGELRDTLRQMDLPFSGKKIITCRDQDKLLHEYKVFLQHIGRVQDAAQSRGGFSITEVIKKLATVTSRSTASLQSKLDVLEPGKVLDVSRLQADGTGARASAAPTARSKKLMYPDLPIVSMDLEHYALALTMLSEDHSQALAYVEAASGYSLRSLAISAESPRKEASVFLEHNEPLPPIVRTAAYGKPSRTKTRDSGEARRPSTSGEARRSPATKSSPLRRLAAAVVPVQEPIPFIPSDADLSRSTALPSPNYDLRRRSAQLFDGTHYLSATRDDYQAGKEQSTDVEGINVNGEVI